jgi:hypothetical protein
MRTIILLTFFSFGTIQFAIAQSSLKRKTNWTVPEVKEWIEKNKNYSKWHGWLLYQGSDTTTHHFISRISDSWVWFNIDRTQLDLKDERPYKTTSNAPLGYYYVDGIKDFVKIKDYR